MGWGGVGRGSCRVVVFRGSLEGWRVVGGMGGRDAEEGLGCLEVSWENARVWDLWDGRKFWGWLGA